jgi:hypothetical protein
MNANRGFIGADSVQSRTAPVLSRATLADSSLPLARVSFENSFTDMPRAATPFRATALHRRAGSGCLILLCT